MCNKCKKNTATVHLTDLIKGEKREIHLCEECAAEEGITVKQQVSITDVLNSFLASQATIQEIANLKCPRCGLTFVEFRSQGTLGCPDDYEVFGEPLASVIAKAQNGKTHHTGKAPGQNIVVDPAQQEKLKLQRELREAVEIEDYRRAAQLRDQLAEMDNA